MAGDEAGAIRARLEAIEARHGDAIAKYLRGNVHVVLPVFDALIRHPALLDAVESILGPDLMVWGCNFFIKEARTAAFVSWHQDLTYWGLDSLDEVTAWLALSPATPENGCMRFVAGSHRRDIVEHHDTFAAGNLLSRGQEIAVEVDESQAVPVVLAPGEMSLHHGRMFHASGPNRSGERRLGLAIRFIPPHVRQVAGERDYAVLVRGEDRFGHFIQPPRPAADLAPEALALHDRIMADQASFLYRGAERRAPA